MDDKIKCPKCGAENIKDSLICNSCGTSLEVLNNNPVNVVEPVVKSSEPEVLDVEIHLPPTQTVQQSIQVEQDITSNIVPQVPLTQPVTQAETPTIGLPQVPVAPVVPPVAPAPVSAPTQTPESATKETPAPAIPPVTPIPVTATPPVAQANNITGIPSVNQPPVPTIPGFENINNVNLAELKQKQRKKTFKILIIVLIIFAIIGGSTYFILNTSNTKSKYDNKAFTSKKDEIKDETGNIHKIGKKSSHYNDSLEDKAKYLLTSKPLDNTYNYIYLNNKSTSPKLLYNNGAEIKLGDNKTAYIYDNFVVVGEFFKQYFYDRYGELVSEDEFLGYDEENKILRTKDDEFYGVNGQIGKDMNAHISNQSNFSLLTGVDPNTDEIIVVNSKNKIVYKSTSDNISDLNLTFSASKIFKYFAITDGGYGNKKSLIVNSETGKIIYQTDGGIEFVSGNIFRSTDENKQIFVADDKVIFETRDELMISNYTVNNNDTIYEKKSGKILPNDIWQEMTGYAYHAYEEDNYQIFICNGTENGKPTLNYGLRKDNQTILDCKYKNIDFFKPALYDELKQKDKYYVVYKDQNNKNALYDIKNKKVLYEPILANSNNRLISVGSSVYDASKKEERKLINIVTGKEITTADIVEIEKESASVRDSKGYTIYNNELEKILFIDHKFGE